MVKTLVARGASPPSRAQTLEGARRKRLAGQNRIRGMSRELGDLPSLVLRVPDPPQPGTVKLTPNRRLQQAGTFHSGIDCALGCI